MKYMFVAALALAGVVSAVAQSVCRDEMICTPIGGCRWVTMCKSPAPATVPMNPPIPAPAPSPSPRPVQCRDEMICTPINGCRWVTICK
jgi:hypothetical protein